jgi:endonuclease/exonuclease/phosphatase (EEP) superfamily protein YafD
MNTLLLIAASCFLCYFVPATIFWDSLFHRVWSLALLCLPLSIVALYHPPLSDYTLPILIFTILDFVLSVALSPAQAILYPREDDGTSYSALKIINYETVQTRISAEFVPPSLIIPVHFPG